MTSLVVGGLFNAVAFAGAGFLFSKLNHTGYEKEMKRHNNALEDLAKAKEVWYENEVAKKDKIQQLRQQLSDANSDINITNHALDTLKQVLRKEETIQFNGKTFIKQPQLNDYYQPSDEMKKYQMIFVGISGLGVGYLIHKVT